MERSSCPLCNRVSPARIGHEVERFAQFYQSVHQEFGTLIVHVVIVRPVNQQQLALKALGKITELGLTIAYCIHKIP
jgi:hypothetical protein